LRQKAIVGEMTQHTRLGDASVTMARVRGEVTRLVSADGWDLLDGWRLQTEIRLSRIECPGPSVRIFRFRKGFVTMTTAARLVLADCKWALSEHTDDLRFEAFRVSWISVVTLLRAVGHVLDKVDSTRSATVKAAIDAWWIKLKQTRPEPAIFWQFIEQERNTVVKQYTYTRSRTAHCDPPRSPGKPNLCIDVTYKRADRLQLSGFEFTNSERMTGPFKGKHEREVAELAIAWWHEQLDAIDRAAGSPKPQHKVVSIVSPLVRGTTIK
jgi:hypothetical protein